MLSTPLCFLFIFKSIYKFTLDLQPCSASHNSQPNFTVFLRNSSGRINFNSAAFSISAIINSGVFGAPQFSLIQSKNEKFNSILYYLIASQTRKQFSLLLRGLQGATHGKSIIYRNLMLCFERNDL